jgi:hypothetical protein
MVINKEMWDDTIKRLKKLTEDNIDTLYLKQTCDDKGNITSLGFYANTEAEKKAYEYCFGVTIEETQLITSLTEKQRKLIILQSQKEKLEKEISELIK